MATSPAWVDTTMSRLLSNRPISKISKIKHYKCFFTTRCIISNSMKAKTTTEEYECFHQEFLVTTHFISQQPLDTSNPAICINYKIKLNTNQISYQSPPYCSTIFAICIPTFFSSLVIAIIQRTTVVIAKIREKTFRCI